MTKFSQLHRLAIADQWARLPYKNEPCRGPGRLCRQWDASLTQPYPNDYWRSSVTEAIEEYPLLALCLSQRYVKEITSYESPCWTLNGNVVEAIRQYSSFTYPVLAHLRVLRVEMTGGFLRVSWANARRLIRAAKRAEELSLSSDCLTAGRLPFDVLVKKNRWPRLSSLSVMGAEISETALIAFFAAHASTLRKIEMSLNRLKKGQWVTVVTQMREILTLEECKLTVGLDDDGVILDRRELVLSNSDVLDLGGYVIHGGDIPPERIGPDLSTEESQSEQDLGLW